MALRSQFVETVTAPLGPSGSLIPVEGIGATIFTCNPDGTDGPQATGFNDRVSDIVADSLATDESGAVSFYLDQGDYNIHLDDQEIPPRITSSIRGFSSVPAIAQANIDSIQSSINTVQSRQATKNALIIPALETITSTTYALAPTADSIPGVVLPTKGLLAIWFEAIWSESVAGAGRIALFLGNNQIQVASSGGAPVPQSAARSAAANIAQVVSTGPTGLFSQNSATGYTADVTTGQILGQANGSTPVSYDLNGTVFTSAAQPTLVGGPFFVTATAGTYTVSVRYKSSSGNVTVSARSLRVSAIPYQ